MAAHNLERLLDLRPGWDGYDGVPTKLAAMATARSLQYVPMSSGGLQIELHTQTLSVEIEIDPDGSVANVSVLPVITLNK